MKKDFFILLFTATSLWSLLFFKEIPEIGIFNANIALGISLGLIVRLMASYDQMMFGWCAKTWGTLLVCVVIGFFDAKIFHIKLDWEEACLCGFVLGAIMLTTIATVNILTFKKVAFFLENFELQNEP